MPNGGDSEASIRNQVAVLRRRWPVVVNAAVLTCVVATVFTLSRPPVYEATASVLLRPSSSERLLVGGTAGAVGSGANDAATEIEVMDSPAVRRAVEAELGHRVNVEIEPRGLTDVIDVRAKSVNRARAAKDATTFVEEYVELRRRERVEALSKSGALIRAQIADLDRRIDALEKPLRELDARLGATEDGRLRSQLQLQRDAAADAISAERRTLESRRASFDDQLNQLQLVGGLDTPSDVQLVSKAELPTDPISAGPVRNGALGLLGGLVLGLGLAFLLDQIDDRLRRKEDVEAAVAGLPVLGILPRVTREHAQGRVVSWESPNSAAAESYRILRTSLEFMAINRATRSLQVTSAASSEGKTTVVSNLAVSFAQVGQRVIVVDCDLRRPRVHDAFGLRNDRGFTSVLLDRLPLAEAITMLEGVPNVAVLASGPVPPNPSELLSSDRARGIFRALKENCDILLIDTPPVLPVTDALVVAREVDATLLVVRSGVSTRRQLVRAHELLAQVSAPLVGLVLNGVVNESGDAYEYGYPTNDSAAADQPPARLGPPPPVSNGTSNGRHEEPTKPVTAAPRKGKRKKARGRGARH